MERGLGGLQDLLRDGVLATTTDPNLVFDLRAKLDVAGFYDEFEVDRVVARGTRSQGQAGGPRGGAGARGGRLMKRYTKGDQTALRAASARQDKTAMKTGRDELDVLTLFKIDAGAFVRLYLSLTDFRLREHGDRAARDLLQAVRAAADRGGRERSGTRAHDRVYGRIIEKLNDLFHGELTDQDKLVYVNDVLMGQLLESTHAPAAGRQQLEAAVRHVPGPQHGVDERHHQRAGRSHHDEHARAQLARRAARLERHPAEPYRPVRTTRLTQNRRS